MSEKADDPGSDVSGLNAIEATALDWFLLLQERGADRDVQTRFETWLAADSRHGLAYESVKTDWADADLLKAAFETQDVLQTRKASPRRDGAHSGGELHRRRHWMWGSALAACAALVIVSAPELALRYNADHRTSVGQQARVDLPDGSLAWLNTDTAIAVDFSPEARVISLLRGEAEFEVRPDVERPFSVRAEGGRATALGTVYTVRDHKDRVDVSVREGRVAVSSPAQSADATVELDAGQRVTYYRGSPPDSAGVITGSPSPWRDGVIIFEDTDLDEALAEVDRYHKGRILLLADKTDLASVSARLSIEDLDEGIDLLAATNGLTVTRMSGYLIIVR